MAAPQARCTQKARGAKASRECTLAADGPCGCSMSDRQNHTLGYSKQMRPKAVHYMPVTSLHSRVPFSIIALLPQREGTDLGPLRGLTGMTFGFTKVRKIVLRYEPIQIVNLLTGCHQATEGC